MYQVITMFGDMSLGGFLKTGKKILKQKKHSSLSKKHDKRTKNNGTKSIKIMNISMQKVTFSAPFGMTEMSAGVKSVTMIYSNTKDLRC